MSKQKRSQKNVDAKQNPFEVVETEPTVIAELEQDGSDDLESPDLVETEVETEVETSVLTASGVLPLSQAVEKEEVEEVPVELPTLDTVLEALAYARDVITLHHERKSEDKNVRCIQHIDRAVRDLGDTRGQFAK